MRFILSFLLISSAACHAKEPQEMAATSGELLSWMLSTLLILAIIFAVAFVIRKSKILRFATGRSELKVTGQVYVGPKARVVQVEAGGKKILVGVTSTNVTFLTSLDERKYEFDSFMLNESESLEDAADAVNKEKADTNHG
ncbi:MAG: FliO/MopB family protein [Succinivibrio sp.]